ncbi:YidB family protein [Acidisphaera rubrifaciens]|uniref:DUF937 domain-containing protein n=1 Tax=Acidisphaera rubrifaciens HS-AP3 TaxID=1231350 RepID=A0A0D6PAE4_9PROT|nr:YidB family protein [Acidisphaera rubrifaciens]GAN78336.1 hypothetical protein Asru_0765_03 [Acidisphaera rubrifaciens HS-AP3]
MSLFGDIVGSLLGGSAQQQGQVPGQPPAQATNVPGALVGLLSQPGALSGLVEHLNQAGLGDVVQSWVSNSSGNQPVDPSDLHAALGPELVQQLAAHTGLPVGDLLQQLATHLPQVVDGMTPDGQVPSHESLTDIGLGLLRSRFAPAAQPAPGDDAT